MGTLQAKYVWKKGQALIPNWVAFAVVNLMEKHFDELVDYAFTAEMEDELDLIADGEREKLPFLKAFYFGDKKQGQGAEEAGARRTSSTSTPRRSTPSTSARTRRRACDIVVKPGRYGPYIKRGEDTVSVPERLAPDEMTVREGDRAARGAQGRRAASASTP